jgi:Mycothiol maleylpyruvate isomerase N-terminal domain
MWPRFYTPEMRPAETIDTCTAAHERLRNAIGELTDDDIAQPSLLPGWSRGYVLTHLAHKTATHVWLFEGAQANEIRDQYPHGFAQAQATNARRTAKGASSDVNGTQPGGPAPATRAAAGIRSRAEARCLLDLRPEPKPPYRWQVRSQPRRGRGVADIPRSRALAGPSVAPTGSRLHPPKSRAPARAATTSSPAAAVKSQVTAVKCARPVVGVWDTHGIMKQPTSAAGSQSGPWKPVMFPQFGGARL